MSAIGVALLWVTGIVPVWSKWGGFGHLPGLFWIKAVFIVTLTVVVGLIHMTYARIRKGNLAVAARLPKLGPLAGVSAILAVLYAVFAFS